MIDCVFLMLVYFMTTSSLEKSEADLPCPVGQAGMAADPLPAVDEQNLALTEKGEVLWNGSRFGILDDAAGGATLLERLLSFKDTCTMAGSDPSLRIVPESKAPQQALVTLLDLVSGSGIETIHFP
jgi:biopolymer transport protein ExbD